MQTSLFVKQAAQRPKKKSYRMRLQRKKAKSDSLSDLALSSSISCSFRLSASQPQGSRSRKRDSASNPLRRWLCGGSRGGVKAGPLLRRFSSHAQHRPKQQRPSNHLQFRKLKHLHRTFRGDGRERPCEFTMSAIGHKDNLKHAERQVLYTSPETRSEQLLAGGPLIWRAGLGRGGDVT